MNFNDDQPIVASQDVSGKRPEPIRAGKTKVKVIKKTTTAPLEESEFTVMLELTGAGSSTDRPGLDLVTVLDVSGSMELDKLQKMKNAMLFMIKKLSPIDRLSIVTFNHNVKTLCPLQEINKTSQAKIEKLVNTLVADGGTDISAGLERGLAVLNDQRLNSWNAVGIMLMSDGKQNRGVDAAKVRVGNVPVHTFGFGADHDPKVLKDIADKSKGGTFSDVQNQNNLTIAFSQCLAGLLTVAVQDLKLTVTQVESTIVKVSAGNYRQDKDNAAGSVIVSFGDLYSKEVRKVIVDLRLPVVSSPAASQVLNITHTYSTGGDLCVAEPIAVTVSRTNRTSGEPETEEVMMEEKRLLTAKMIQEASVMADGKKLDDALDKLVEAENLLADVLNDESNPLIEMLKSELQQMKSLMTTQEIYKKQGLPFALSSETSHNRQRFAARGDDVVNLRLFATPRMDAYLKQAMSFDENPNKPPPSVDEDEKQELTANPLAPITGALRYYTQTAIQSFNSIDNILNTAESLPYVDKDWKQELVRDLSNHAQTANQSLRYIEDKLNQLGLA